MHALMYFCLPKNDMSIFVLVKLVQKQTVCIPGQKKIYLVFQLVNLYFYLTSLYYNQIEKHIILYIYLIHGSLTYRNVSMVSIWASKVCIPSVDICTSLGTRHTFCKGLINLKCRYIIWHKNLVHLIWKRSFVVIWMTKASVKDLLDRSKVSICILTWIRQHKEIKIVYVCFNSILTVFQLQRNNICHFYFLTQMKIMRARELD